MPDSLIAFSPAQLAVIVVVLAASLVWAVKFGFSRLIMSIDTRFDKLEESIEDIRENHPTRNEVQAAVDGVHRRVDDIHRRRSTQGHHNEVVHDE